MKKKRSVIKEVWLYSGGSVVTKDTHGRRRSLRSVDCLPSTVQVKMSMLDAVYGDAPESLQHVLRGFSIMSDVGIMDSFHDDCRMYSFKRVNDDT